MIELVISPHFRTEGFMFRCCVCNNSMSMNLSLHSQIRFVRKHRHGAEVDHRYVLSTAHNFTGDGPNWEGEELEAAEEALLEAIK